jgi:O-antigen/teichoic acid export membrane protein
MKNNGIDTRGGQEAKVDLSRGRIARAMAVYVPGAIVPALLSFASISIFSRMVSTEAYGRYSLVLNAAGLTILLSTQWIEQAIQRFFPTAADTPSRERLKVASIGAVGMALLALLAVGAIVAPFVLRSGANALKPFLLPAAIYIIVSCLWNMAASIMLANLESKPYVKYKLLLAVLQFSTKLGLLLLFLAGDSSALLWGSVIAMGLLLPFTWHSIRLPRVPALLTQVRQPSLKADIASFASYGIPLSGWYAAGMLLSVGDRYVIQFFRGAGAVGVYAANYQLIEGISNLVFAPFLLAIHPYIISYWRHKSREETAHLLGQIVELFLLVGIVGCGLVWVFARQMSLLLDAPYHEGFIILPWVFGGVFLWNLGLLVHKPLEFEKKTLMMFAFGIICAILNLILNLVFVPLIGYFAAGYTTFASYLAYVVTVTVYGRRIVKWRLPHPQWTVGLAAASLAGFVLLEKGATAVGLALGQTARLSAESVGAGLLTTAIVIVAVRKHAWIIALIREMLPTMVAKRYGG